MSEPLTISGKTLEEIDHDLFASDNFCAAPDDCGGYAVELLASGPLGILEIDRACAETEQGALDLMAERVRPEITKLARHADLKVVKL